MKDRFDWLGAGARLRLGLPAGLGVCLLAMAMCGRICAQAVTTTTVQGTVYLANGQVGAGTLILSWPAFTTASGQSVTADHLTVPIAPDGFVSVNVAPNLGATPAGLYYTAVYYLSDGTTTTQYWVVPAAASATLAQVQAQLMPAAQAVQAVSKAYVDGLIEELEGSLLTASGGTLTGPLYLNGDPTQPLQAADKHYVDETFALAVPLTGGNMTGELQAPEINGVESPLAGTSQTTLQAAVNAAGSTGAMQIPPTYAGADTFTNPNGVHVTDLRPGPAAQRERSVKEFGAVCDGATDDTNALQAALNYANAHGVTLTVPQGTCKTHTLNWRGESIGGLGKQVSALMGFPGQDILASGTDSLSILSYTRVHDLTFYVDQSLDVSCSAAEGRASAGSCGVSRLMEKNSIFSPGGNGLTGTAGTGAGWAVGNCAIAMPAATGAGGNGLRTAEIENIEIAATGTDPLAAAYPGAHSTHTCGLYLAQWPQWSEFRNIDIRGLNTGVAIPALPVATPAGLNADSNRWQNITIQATHAFTAAAGSNNVLDNVAALAGNSAATGEPPTGLVLDFAGTQQGWTIRNAVVLPTWNIVKPQLAVTASGGAVTAVTVGSEHGLGFDPYGTQVPLGFSGSCTAAANAAVNSDGSLGAVTITTGGAGCSGTTTAAVNAAGTWDTDAPVNLISGQDMTLFAGNLLKGSGGYTVWNASNSESNGTQLGGGGGNLPGGGTYPALVASTSLGSTLAVDQFPGADFGAKLQACIGALSAVYGGTCDARNFTGSLSMAANLTISMGNIAVLLPCATISTANQIIVTAGTRNVSLRGCALRGGSAASGSQGGTAFLYSGTGAMFQVGDPTYAVDTQGFHLDDVVIDTTAATAASAQGLAAYRVQELNLEELYLLGNSNQTGITLDGTGNYTGGSFFANNISGYQTAINAIGHQIPNAATTDWLNASTFVRLHIDCPTSGGNPISGTIGINLQQGDGNTITGGDVEGCGTALHLGANAQNNTIVGLRNENSSSQVVADAGSAYNNWITGGTMFSGKLTDNGARNSFLDTFHRSFNGMNGDWYGSQQDVTITDHERLGTGLGNERGRLTEYQTDYGYRWEEGLTDATSGMQSYTVEDLLNNVPRLSIGQYLSSTADTVTNVMVNSGGCYSTSTPPAISFTGGGGAGAAATAVMGVASSISCSTYKINSIAMTSGGTGYTSQPAVTFTATNQTSAPSVVAEITTAGSTDNQTVINAAGTGAVVLNGSNNSGTGGVVFGSGGTTETTVASVNSAGNAAFSGTLAVGSTTQSTGTVTVRNNADAEVDYYLWPGLTTSQKGSYTYKDWDGSSQWYMVKDESDNWSLNSALGGLDSFKAFQSTNSGDTYVDASNNSGTVRVNYEAGSGAAFNIYGGSSSSLYASFTAANAIKLPGLAASSGHDCLQIDNSGFVTNTGAACGSGGGGGGSGTVNSGTTGQIAYYTAAGTTVGGETSVPVSAGGTGATTAASALTNLGAQAAIPGLTSDGSNGISVTAKGTFGGAVTASAVSARNMASIGPRYDVTQYGAVGNNSTDDTAAIQSAYAACWNSANDTVPGSGYGGVVEFPGGKDYVISSTIYTYDSCGSEGIPWSQNPAVIRWNGPAAGTVYSATTFTVAANSTPYYPAYSPSPSPAPPYTITFPVTNSVSVNNWVLIQGFSTATGMSINNTVAQVVAATGSSFTVALPITPATTGTITDTGTVTTINVMMASDTGARYWQVIKDLQFQNQNGIASANKAGVDVYFGDRVDSGTKVEGVWATNPSYYGYYFSQGGIDVDLDRWRADSPGIAGIYWRISGQDNFGIANGTVSSGSGGTMLLDNSACNQGYAVRVTSRNMGLEVQTGGLTSGIGEFQLLDCPSDVFPNQFDIDMENTKTAADAGAVNYSTLVMSPPSDTALSLNIVNGVFPNGISPNTTQRWVGVPSLARYDASGTAGIIPSLTYAPSLASAGSFNADYVIDRSMSQCLGDCNIGQLWQYGVQASAFLYSDTAYTALPNATTLFAGQILAPPGYWSGANGSRYALDVVYQTGTTGIPNGAATTCETSSTADQFVCTSATDLGTGEHISVGANTNKVIYYVDATNPASVLVWTTTSLTTVSSPAALSFAAPVLGPEMQLATKSSAAPTTLAWSRGDWQQNSSASANGVAGWVNVSAGTPGTWAGIPLGNSSGQITPSQISSTTGSGSVVLASGPTFSGNTTTFANGAAAEQDVSIQPGSTADQVGALEWNTYSGTAEWKLRKDASNYLRLTDVANSLDRAIFYQSGQSLLNAGAGSNAVVVNGTTGSGTAGLLVESGGSSPAAVLTVTGSGNTTATGFVQGKFMLGSGTMSLAANAATGSSPTIACATSHVCDGVSGTVTLTTGTSTTTGTLATLTFPNTHTDDANCLVMPTLSGTGHITSVSWSESTTALTLTANAALTASTAYQIRYWCGGN